MPTRRTIRRPGPLTSRLRPAAAPTLLAVLAAAALAGCSLVENEAQRQADEAERRAEEAVSGATADAGEQVQGEVQEQADAILDESLDAVDTPCSDYLATAEADRADVASGILRAIWLTELRTEEPPADVVTAYAGAIATGCEGAPDSRVTDVARAAYDTGAYAPPRG